MPPVALVIKTAGYTHTILNESSGEAIINPYLGMNTEMRVGPRCAPRASRRAQRRDLRPSTLCRLPGSAPKVCFSEVGKM